MTFSTLPLKSELLTPSPLWDMLDASKLSCFQDCARKYFYQYILGWRIDSPDLAMEFGSAWHCAMEALLRNKKTSSYLDSVPGAYEEFLTYYRRFFDPELDANNEPRGPDGCQSALVEYAAQYINDEFNVLYTEVTGSVPITDTHSMCFKIDAIVEGPEGIYCLEHKTTSMDAEYWKAQWYLSLQVNTYIHTLYTLFRDKVYGAKINTAVFRKKGNLFFRLPVRRTFKHMGQWLWNMSCLVGLLEWNHKALANVTDDQDILTAFPMCDGSCTKYNRSCPYHVFCCSDSWANPLQRAAEPPLGFICSHWDPAAKHAETAKFEVKDGTIRRKETL